MFNAIQTKLLIAIVVLLVGISSYLAYERHQRKIEQQKTDKAFERMKTEGRQAQPSGWAKSLKDK